MTSLQIFASPHRSLFLSAAVYGCGAMAAWTASFLGLIDLTPDGRFAHMRWHGHEMLFGFAAAAIAGFLSAAVPNWTGRPRLAGIWPPTLAVVWLAGRTAPWLSVGQWFDLAFLPLVAALIARDIIATRNQRNYQVPVLLLLMAACNLAFYDLLPGDFIQSPDELLTLAQYPVLAIVVLIGGRVLPVFTTNALRLAAAGNDGDGVSDIECRSSLVLDQVAVPLVIVTMAGQAVMPGSKGSAVVALLAGIVVALRARHWRTLQTWRQPLLWSLHIGYGWAALGLILVGLSGLGLFPDSLAAHHAIGGGAIGVMILAMASRAALGHAGMPLRASPKTVAAYILVNIAVVLRVFVAPFDGADTTVTIAGILWTAGYGLFAFVYAPILLRPRIDGKPG